MLESIGLSPKAIEGELAEMSELGFGRTRSRSLLGSMTDFSLNVRVYFATRRDESLEEIARALAETTILPLDGACPIDLTRAASVSLRL